MIRHIVLFELIEFDSPAEKMGKLEAIKSRLEGLVGVVPTLKTMEVGINCNPKQKYDIGLVSTFNSMEDLNAYVAHPAHQEVSVGFIHPLIANRACVDSEF